MKARTLVEFAAICLFFGLAMTTAAEAQYFWPAPSPLGGGSYVYPYQYYSSPYFYNQLPQPSIGTYLPYQPRPPLPYERFILPPPPYYYYYYGPPAPYYQPYPYYYYPWVPNGPYLYRQYVRPYPQWRSAPWPHRRFRTSPRTPRQETAPKTAPKSDNSTPKP